MTLETDLAGQGDVPVTYPADAKAQLELPGPLDARVLVQHARAARWSPRCRRRPGAAHPRSPSSPARTTPSSAEGQPRAVPLRADRRPRDAARHQRVHAGRRPTLRRPRASARGRAPLRERDRWALEGASVGLSRRRPTRSPAACRPSATASRASASPRARLTLGAVARPRAPHRRRHPGRDALGRHLPAQHRRQPGHGVVRRVRRRHLRPHVRRRRRALARRLRTGRRGACRSAPSRTRRSRPAFPPRRPTRTPATCSAARSG